MRNIRTLVATIGAGVLAAATMAAGGQISADTTNEKPAAGRPNTVGIGVGNLGLHKERVKEYYGDDGDGWPSSDSEFAHDVALRRHTARFKLRVALASHDPSQGTPAVVLDVDDTTLSTYNYEVINGFAYDREEAEQYVKEHVLEPIIGMPRWTRWASRQGVEVFYLSGRPEDQRRYTARDLQARNYPDVRAERVLLRDRANPPEYLEHCAPRCTTEQFRSGTRKHLESQGYHILLNVGDQRSDLTGGYSEYNVRIPNPMYYLP